MAQQERKVGQRLDVADHRRKTGDALLERARWLIRGLGRAPVDGPDGGGLLAGHITEIDRDDADVTPAENIGVEVGQRGLDA